MTLGDTAVRQEKFANGEESASKLGLLLSLLKKV